MADVYSQVADILNESNNIVFFGGAGVSTECGIPDFRSTNGIYNQKYNYDYNPETILSHSFFQKNPEIFYDFVRKTLIKPDVKPNKGHRALAELEKIGKLKAVITQNIDGLHQAAGSKNVVELHGSLQKFYCKECHKEYGLEYISKGIPFPKCTCGGVVRPNVVLYEEALDENIISDVISYIQNADVLIVAGTSLAVYPAAAFIKYFKGSKVIFINKTETPYDNFADIIISEPFAKTMMKIMLNMKIWTFKTKIVSPYEDKYTPHPIFKGVDMYPFLSSDENLGIRSQYARLHPNGGEIEPHTHDIIEVFTVIKGNPHILIDGDWIQVEEGYTICAYPGEMHGVKNNTNNEIIIECNFKC